MEIIGVSGYARAGKDEVAKSLVDYHGFTRIAFADKLRDVLYALNPIVGWGWQAKGKDFPHEPVLVQNVIDRFGWNGYKETAYGMEIRRLLQRLGTEAGRELLGDNIWVDAALTGHPEDAKLVIPDVRFPNEAEAIRNAGGTIWRIERPGVGPANAHPSETALDNYRFDCQISNDGTLAELSNKVSTFYGLVNRKATV